MKYLNFANRITNGILVEIVMVIIDLSDSMKTRDWKPSRKAGAIKANKGLIKVKAQHYPKDMVGIIGFGTDAQLLHEPVELAKGTERLHKTLRRLPGMGWTNFNVALELAEACLFGKTATSTDSCFLVGLSELFSQLFQGPGQSTETSTKEDASNTNCLRRIIMLTDGDYNEGGAPFKVGKRLKDAGVIIDCIGIGTKKDINEKAMQQIASRNPDDGSIRYCWIGDQQKLIKKYETLAHHIRPA